MPLPVALQLYSVREAAEKDYAAAVRTIASFGYAGVETAGFPGIGAEAAGKLYRELGLAVPSAHTALPLGNKKNQVIEEMQAIGSKRIISPAEGRDKYKTVDGIKQVRDLFNEASAVAKQYGMTLGVHNHWWEYMKVEGDGRYAYQILQEGLDPDVFFQVDVYWTQTAGVDPAKAIKELGKRVLMLHLKDGPCNKEDPMTALGDGVVDIPAVVKAGEVVGSDWLVVELDRCATDMYEAVKKSLDYLKLNSLGRGR